MAGGAVGIEIWIVGIVFHGKSVLKHIGWNKYIFSP